MRPHGCSVLICTQMSHLLVHKRGSTIRIAIASDNAFCIAEFMSSILLDEEILNSKRY